MVTFCLCCTYRIEDRSAWCSWVGLWLWKRKEDICQALDYLYHSVWIKAV